MPIHELGSQKTPNFTNTEKIGPRIEKWPKTGFEACEHVENSEGAVQRHVARNRGGKPPIHWNIY